LISLAQEIPEDLKKASKAFKEVYFIGFFDWTGKKDSSGMREEFFTRYPDMREDVISKVNPESYEAPSKTTNLPASASRSSDAAANEAAEAAPIGAEIKGN